MSASSAAPRAVATTVPVCAGSSVFAAEPLRTALHARTADADTAWDVVASTQLPAEFVPAITVCDAEAVAAMTDRWPGCAVIAVVPAHDDGTAVIAALHAGAATCIRGDDVAVAAAFIAAVARRGGLLGDVGRR